MPADPYTLGIGVEVDRRVTRDALGRFARTVEDDARPVGDALADALGTEDLFAQVETTWLDKMLARLKSVRGPAREAFESVRSFVDSFREGTDFLRPAEELENATQRIAVTMGGGRREAAALRDEIFELAETTTFSIGEITQLEHGLSNTGQTIGSFSADAQNAIARLNQTFGVSGEEIGKTSVTMRGFGGDIEGLLGDATAFTKSFKIPGVFQELPAIVDGARESVLRFGSRIVGSGAQIVQATLKMSGAFVKTFGTTIADAVSRAQDSLSKFAGAARQDAKVFLGLETEFSGLTVALMQTGIGVQESMRLVRDGASGSMDAIMAIGDRIDMMPEGLMKDRFIEQLRDELSPEMFALAANVDSARDRFLDAQRASAEFTATAGGQGVAAFNDLGSSVLDTTIELRNMFNNMLELTRAVIGNVAITMGLPEILKDVKNRFADWAGRIRDFTKSGEFVETIEKWKPTLVEIGSKLLTIGTVVTSVGGAVLGLGSTFLGVTTGARAFDTVLGRLGGAVPGLGRVFEAMGGGPLAFIGKMFKGLVSKAGPIGLAIAAFQGIKTYVMEAGAVLGDPNATGIEKFSAIMSGATKGIAKFVDTILLGIPSALASVFFPDLEQQFDVGFHQVMGKISAFFDGGGGILATVGTAIGGVIGRIGDFMLANMPDFKDFAHGFGKALGGALAGMQKFMAEILMGIGQTVVGAFTGMFSDGVTAAGDTIMSQGGLTIGESFLVILDTIGETLISFFGGLAEGILGTFGVSLKSVGLTFQILWEEVKFNALEVFRDLGEGASTWFFDPLSLGLLNVANFFEEVWENVFAVTATVFVKIGGAATTAFAGVKMLAASMAETVALAFTGMATQAIDALGAMVAALPDVIPGVEGMKSALAGAKTAVSGLGSGFSQMATAAAQEVADSQARSTERTAAIERERVASLSAIDAQRTAELEFFAQKKQARDEEEKKREAEHDAKIDQLTSEMAAAQVALEQEQAAATAARREKQTARTQLEQALVDASGTTVPTEAAPAAVDGTELIRRTGGTAGGGEATSQTQNVLGGRAPGDVAASAGGRPVMTGGQGQGAEAMSQMMRSFKADVQRAQGPQRVEIKITGGDDVSRALQRNARVRNLSANGGGS